MTDEILHIACAASVLIRRDTWAAFNWNRSEVGLREAIRVLRDDIGDLTYEVIYGKDRYFDVNR